MAATDTIVGITGAVLLALVMVGVFVYEYNNAPATASPDAEMKTHFTGDYPALDPNGDLDGDHKLNYNDTDIDGDGLANANDTTTVFTQRFTGSMAAPSPPATQSPAQEFKIHVENGTIGAVFTLTYNTTTPAAPAGLPVPTLPVLGLALAGGDASPTLARSQASGSTAVTVTLTVSAELPAGEYTLRVSQDQAGPTAAFAVKSVLDYGKGHAGADDHAHA